MQVAVESGEGLERRMRVSLSAERFDQEVEKRLKQIARTARLPGFRPGKVPLNLLRRRYAGQVQGEVFGELVESTFAEAVTQESLRPAGRPKIDPEINADEKTYAYTATFEVLPQIELAALDAITVERPAAQVTDDDLDEMIERLRRQRRTWTPTDRPCQPGDQVRVSFVGTVDGEPFDGGEGKSVPVEIGSGMMIEGFEDGLIGCVTGDERTLDLAFPADYRVKSLAGKPASFRLTVESVAEPVLPPVDEALARAFGVEDGDIDHFRRDVRKNMERELKQRVHSRIKHQVMEALIEANQIDLPKALVQQEIASLKQQTRAGVSASGNFELPDSLFEPQARRRVALGLIIAEIVKRHGISADPDRVRETVEDMASTYEDPKEVIDFYMGNREQRASVESLVLEDQVVDWVLQQAKVEEKPYSFKELTESAQ